MATVTFNEPTNVYALSTSVAFTGGTFQIPGSSSNDLEFYSGSVSESFLGNLQQLRRRRFRYDR